MSFDHWWIGLFVDEAGYERLKPAFAAAAEQAVLSPQSEQAIAAWRKHPSDFDQGAAPRSPEAEDEPHRFIWAFNLPGFVELAGQFIVSGGTFTEFLVEEEFFQMATCARRTPVGILWQALGYQRAACFPARWETCCCIPVRSRMPGKNPPRLCRNLAAGSPRCGAALLQLARR